MQQEEFDVAKWFAGFLAGNLTEKERMALDAWKAASRENADLFEKVCREEHVRELNRMAGQYDRETAWKNIEGHFKVGRTVSFRRWMRWAAVWVIPLGICLWYFGQAGKDSKETEMAAESRVGQENARAILTMADGSVVNIGKTHASQWEEKDGTRIAQDSAGLTYLLGGGEGSAEQMYNKVEIPRGSEYVLVLSDGTSVILNTLSTLRYPVNFTGDIREVELTGEAYFNVKHNPERPFIVRTQDVRIQVLGTEFNVSAYAEEETVKTTLVRGSVNVESRQGGHSVVIEPDQQAVFDKSSGELAVKEVDVAEYIAWKNGKFDFRDWRLEDMMNYLSRWYPVEVFYQTEELKDIRFGCYINRYSEIKPIVEFLESTGKVGVTQKGNTIIFNRK